MAGRTGMSVGVGVTITLLGMSTAALFVTTAIYLAKYNSTNEELKGLRSENDKYIKSIEKNEAKVSTFLTEAKKENKSLVAYLSGRVGGLMGRVTGVENSTFDEFEAKVKERVKDDSSPLLTILQNRDEQISTLQGDMAVADKDRADVGAELTRVRGSVEQTQKTLIAENDRLKTMVNGYESEIKSYRDGLASAEDKMTTAIRSLEADAAARTKKLEGKVSSLERENLTLVELVSKLRGEQSKAVLSAQAEEALVDGRVIAVSPNGREVSLDLGSKQKLQLGMTFAVYTDGKQIKTDEKTGDYKRGKATLEVINVAEDVATCRITSETKGQPVVKGDVVANAVYDPKKVYKFVVFGNFDSNGDGTATPGERNDFINMVEAWGGKAVSELSGDVDFLILGEKPILPPKPGADVPFEVVQQYVKVEQEAMKYDELYKAAASTSVPILNQNRFGTLIGRTRR